METDDVYNGMPSTVSSFPQAQKESKQPLNHDQQTTKEKQTCRRVSHDMTNDQGSAKRRMMPSASNSSNPISQA